MSPTCFPLVHQVSHSCTAAGLNLQSCKLCTTLINVAWPALALCPAPMVVGIQLSGGWLWINRPPSPDHQPHPPFPQPWSLSWYGPSILFLLSILDSHCTLSNPIVNEREATQSYFLIKRSNMSVCNEYEPRQWLERKGLIVEWGGSVLYLLFHLSFLPFIFSPIYLTLLLPLRFLHLGDLPASKDALFISIDTNNWKRAIQNTRSWQFSCTKNY